MNRRLPAALLALALLLAPSALRAQDAAPEKPAETDTQLLERITGEMAKKVEEIRGLKFKKDVERVWKSRDEAKAEMLASIDDELPPEKLAALSREMAFFGLCKEGTDIKEMFSDFISAGAGGYYIPKTKVFSLVRGFNEDASRPIVFHELIHAVEDQYFDYNARQEKYGDADMSDHSAAIQAMVEGSARYWEDQFVDGEAGLRMKYFQGQAQAEGMGESAKKVMDLPPALIIGMVFYPYGNGSAFHHHVVPGLKAATPKEAFDRIFANPPSAPEQILPPQKYLDGDLPREVKLPDLLPVLGEGWTRLGGDTQGEFGIGLVVNASLHPYNMMSQAMLVMKMPTGPFASQEELVKFQMTPVVEFKGETSTAAGGWDGDRYFLAGNGDRACLGWVSVWDAPSDAAEFAATYGKVIGKKYARVTETTGEDGKVKKSRTAPESAEMTSGSWTGSRWAGTRDGDSAVLVSGDRVIVVERAPEEKLAALVEALGQTEVAREEKDSLPAK